jgi:hypothetical protein
LADFDGMVVSLRRCPDRVPDAHCSKTTADWISGWRGRAPLGPRRGCCRGRR